MKTSAARDISVSNTQHADVPGQTNTFSKASEIVHASPRQVMQRKRIDEIFGNVARGANSEATQLVVAPLEKERQPTQCRFSDTQKAAMRAAHASVDSELLEQIIYTAELVEPTRSGIETMVYNLVCSKNLRNPMGLLKLLKQILAARHLDPEETNRNSSGFIFELCYATEQALSNQYFVQLGAINGIGGDIVLRDKLSATVTTLHLKYLTGSSEKTIKNNFQKAMRQLSESSEERPEAGSHRKIVLMLESIEQPMAVVNMLITFLKATPLARNVDEVELIANTVEQGEPSHEIFTLIPE